MIRALETVEGITYRQILDKKTMAEGRATLVKLMAEPGASTILVNACLFLNVLSFRYLTFETDPEGAVTFELVADGGMVLQLTPAEDEDEATAAPNPRAARLMEVEAFDPDAYAILDDDDEDDAR
jgi:hypothetical protein